MGELPHDSGVEMLILRIGKDPRLLLLRRVQNRSDHGLEVLELREHR